MSEIPHLILHSNVQDVLQQLDAMLVLDENGKSPGMYFLVGHRSSGKERVVMEWIRGSHLCLDAPERYDRPRIAYCNTWKPVSSILGSKNYVRAITCVTFVELAYGLGKVAEAFPVTYAAKQWYRKPKSLYTDRQFTSLFAFLRSEIDRLRVRAIVINGASLIDENTLEMLVLLRHHCNDQLSIILVAELAERADIDEPLAGAFRLCSEASAICRRMELQRLKKREYQSTVLPALTEQLNLAFADDLLTADVVNLVPEALWRYTEYDWDVIDRLVKSLKGIRQGRDGLRTIDRKTLEAILGKPLRSELA